MARLTKWFGPDVKPTIKGVYNTGIGENEHGYQFWNGAQWGFRSLSPDAADQLKREKSCLQSVKWRGLAEKPE